MITLRKWYPFVHPSQRDIREIASEKRAERLENEYKEALKANKMRVEVADLEIELYNKRAEKRTVELTMFNDRNRFDQFV